MANKYGDKVGYLLQSVEMEKAFLKRLLWIDYRKPKYMPKVWSRNNFGNMFNKMDRGWMM